MANLKSIKDEIRDGCEHCIYCHKDSWEQRIPWCQYKKRPGSILDRGTNYCVFWNK